jgi:DNA-binding NarL/FixJ family response regulator
MKRDVPTCLDLLAILCAADEPRRACRLLGAAMCVRETMGSSRAPADTPQVERAESIARRSLSSLEWESEFAAGRGLSLHQAVLFALESAPPATLVGPLSQREREVAMLIGRGLSNREISDTLVLSVRTIEAHVGHVLNKLGLRSRAQIAVWAVEHGLVAAESARPAR